MASEESSWMPATGRHPVTVGSSLGRALKARKGGPPAAKRATLPDRDFYSFRYNFKPESIDSSQPGTISVKGNDGPSSVAVERSGMQDGEKHIYTGTEQTANMECVCVLIYDEETGAFTLEKLDSLVVLAYDKKIASGSVSRRPSSSPLAPPRPPIEDRDFDLEAQLERDMMDEDADAEGEMEDMLPTKQEEEESEEEILPPPREPSPPPPVAKPRPKPRPTAPKPKAPSTTLNPTSATATKPKPKPATNKSKAIVGAKPKREVVVEEERFVLPARPVSQPKRRRQSPPSEGLALPGTFAAPPPLTAPAAPITQSPSDSEEEWLEVPASVAAPATAPSPAAPSPALHGDIFMEEDEEDVEEIDDAFEAEFNEHFGGEEEEEDEDDFLAGAVEEEPSLTTTSGPPMSINQMMGGGGLDDNLFVGADDDDYSSSEESDED